jgi:uncharacterized protein (DUF4415 family)
MRKKPDLIDDENPEWRREDFAKARPLREIMPPAFFDGMEQLRKRGRPRLAAPKVVFSLRLPADLVEAIRASGPGYRARVEKLLRVAVSRKRLLVRHKRKRA